MSNIPTIASQHDLDAVKCRGAAKLYPDKPKIAVGTASCGLAAGAGKVLEALYEQAGGGKDDVIVAASGCLGFCQMEPLVTVYRPGQPKLVYSNVTVDAVDALLASAAEGGGQPDGILCRIDREEIVVDGVWRELCQDGPGDEFSGIPSYGDIPFFAKQKRVVLRNCGFVDPDDIEEYIGRGGYAGLLKVLTSMQPEDVIQEVKQSGLRGRGGGGFPTGVKWGLCRESKGKTKYIICNADEGDPGAYMDRSVLEGDPHSVLEGMLIGAFAIGAQQGIIYARTEYPLAIQKLRNAIDQARAYGLLGDGILGKNFDFDISLVEGAGAFVCGEETSLIASIEGRPAEPSPRPPFPAQSGLWGKPTNINNVETWANVPVILSRGSDWFAQMGTEKSKGTKVFSLVGAINNTGLVEVPMGISLREIVYDIGEGVLGGKRLKAVQTGGPSGGCIPAHMVEMPVDYEKLAEVGSIMGSGGMVVMDESNCMVDIARYFTSFTRDESCGKCNSCRDGLDAAHQILTRITDGEGTPEDLDLLEGLSLAIKDASQCGLGKTAPNPILSTLQFFKDEYAQHVIEKKCPAIVCKKIISTSCRYNCPVHTDVPSFIALIAKGEYEKSFEVIREDNPLPIVCGYICHHPCEDRCRAVDSGADPLSVKSLKRFVGDELIRQDKLKAPAGGAEALSKKVAVIGSGPAGIAAAFDLKMWGYDVTVFERDVKPGGMISQAIPRYRLPQEILDREIGVVEEIGVRFQTNACLGRDVTLDGLREEGYEAVILATGTHRSLTLGIPGEDTPGVLDSLEFLKEIGAGKTPEVGRRVGVVGGGNAAIDAARSAWRCGAEEVTMIYRRTQAEMPAIKGEIEAGLEEGIRIERLAAPVRVAAEAAALRVECIRMQLGEADSSGRPRPIPIPGSEFVMELDNLIVAIGQEADIAADLGGEDLAFDEKGNLQLASGSLMTSRPGVFACGDMVTGPSTIADSIAHGKRAARAVRRHLQGDKTEPTPRVLEYARSIPPVELSEEEIDALQRPEEPTVPVEQRKSGFCEVELGLCEGAACQEARRCLRCDLEYEEE